MNYLEQGSDVTVKIGPFVDIDDGSTLEDSLTITSAEVLLSKDGGAYGAASADQGASDVGAPYDAQGEYDIDLDATDTGTLGVLKISIIDSAALPVWVTFEVISAKAFAELQGAAYNESGGRIWYVAASGGDDGGLGTRGDPFATLAFAMSVVYPSDTIHLLSGTHTLTSAAIFAGGPRFNNITLEGEGWDLIPNGTKLLNATTSNTLSLGRRMTVRNMRIDNTAAAGVAISCTIVSGDALIEDVVSVGTNYGISANTCHNLRILGGSHTGSLSGIYVTVCSGLFINSTNIISANNVASLGPLLIGSNVFGEVRNSVFDLQVTNPTNSYGAAVGVEGAIASSVLLFDCCYKSLVALGSSSDAAAVRMVTGLTTPHNILVYGGSVLLQNFGSGTLVPFVAIGPGVINIYGVALNTTLPSVGTVRFLDANASDLADVKRILITK